MVSSRDVLTGNISVRSASFTVIVSEADVKIFVADALVHQWKLRRNRDEKSPRSRPTMRGSR
jgi:hypothetical protein